ncbi:MAG: threonine/serine ThrE exporter family protein [Bacillota bacterium]
MLTARQVLKIAGQAGKIILANGAEIYRTEDTMMKICHAYGIDDVESFVTPTGIILSIDDGEYIHTKLKRVHNRTMNLDKISKINSFSRRLQRETLNYQQALAQLKKIENDKPVYSFFVMTTLTSVACAMYVILVRADYINFFPALLASFASQLTIKQSGFLKEINYIPEMIAGFIAGLVALLFYRFVGADYNLSVITVSGILAFVPGVSATNAIRDAIDNDLISATSRGTEVILSSISLAAGVALSLGGLNL